MKIKKSLKSKGSKIKDCIFNNKKLYYWIHPNISIEIPTKVQDHEVVAWRKKNISCLETYDCKLTFGSKCETSPEILEGCSHRGLGLSRDARVVWGRTYPPSWAYLLASSLAYTKMFWTDDHQKMHIDLSWKVLTSYHCLLFTFQTFLSKCRILEKLYQWIQ